TAMEQYRKPGWFYRATRSTERPIRAALRSRELCSQSTRTAQASISCILLQAPARDGVQGRNWFYLAVSCTGPRITEIHIGGRFLLSQPMARGSGRCIVSVAATTNLIRLQA